MDLAQCQGMNIGRKQAGGYDGSRRQNRDFPAMHVCNYLMMIGLCDDAIDLLLAPSNTGRENM
ncbi:hypothetical protein [Diaphorobacter ruginosibacter]|uniref:hypothetical protein n=1 Tax=Diaphorobacter ruginosibacter TaxID=1715720 RepID=UPI001FE339F2|nr:hypothetical protein [Diaphorobacter ruginosibacter]MDR2336146.1 hypothetical protein [Burkholderiaceae bacterium]